ncbi:rhodanese-like domain-containing protein [Flavilitoribacter nigricans]|uniref:Rhodanese domain-containing protein n=1 Tax=Flavilitoribacter nigricans (strain ATCC 23147 / DSM 23189 / NBRC 102662 / NCIMB 1420 / SS-2) TaxID=1122177 RepID=A0A2D0N7H5_FLAN2|nr:rhodanese-like domain-containing protein [Flavilitoribacter nigricans]PHN04472.1 hypothetical protein CRP01_20910 [Flavilitoribacter nigricans DSM 23189 = NBRC 102662]
MRRSIILGFLFCLALTAISCGDNAGADQTSDSEKTTADAPRAPFENISVAEFQQKMSADNTVVLDVRTPGEVEAGVIDGALTIDISDPDFQKKIGELDKDKTYLVYCQSGGRSARACEMMSDMGFESLFNLEDGYMAWPK